MPTWIYIQYRRVEYVGIAVPRLGVGQIRDNTVWLDEPPQRRRVESGI